MDTGSRIVGTGAAATAATAAAAAAATRATRRGIRVGSIVVASAVESALDWGAATSAAEGLEGLARIIDVAGRRSIESTLDVA